MTRIILIILILTLSCDESSVEGCTSPTACNYAPRATQSNGDCIQPAFCDKWCPDFDNQGNPIDSTPPSEPGEYEEWDDFGEDCSGACRGIALVDECGDCIVPGGESDNIPPIETDEWNEGCLDNCEGIPNGTLILDCNDDCGGTAYIDDCGECTGGQTGFDPNFLKDECGICGGDGYTNGPLNDGINACIGTNDCDNMDCTGVCNPNINTSYSTFSDLRFCNEICGEECGWKPFLGCIELNVENFNDPPCASEQLGACYLYGANMDFCSICSGGISGHEADSDKDCNGICFGTSIEDCLGICGGNSIVDECGICEGNGLSYDCENWGENNICHADSGDTPICFADIATQCYAPDECGVCDGTGPGQGENCEGECVAEGDNLNENGYDCANTCGGNAQSDDCGLCNGDGYSSICIGTENCNHMDCAGNCTGTSNFGAALDCFGICLGSALYGCDGECCAGATGNACAETDNCGICDNDSFNDCSEDCAGVYGGSADIDNCGICSGGTTGIEPNQGTTPDGLYSCSDITLLVNAGVCTDSDDCGALTCPTLLWDGTNLDGFNFSACGINSVPSYVTGFDISILSLNDNSFNSFPENIINMTSLSNVDLRFNLIGSIPSSVCTLTANPCTVDIRDNLIFDCSQIPDCNITCE